MVLSVGLPARAYSRRIHQYVAVALESSLHHCGEVARLLASLVDGDAARGQSGKIHEQVVDEVFDASVVVSAENASQCQSVGAAKGVVADEGIAASVAVVGEVFPSFHVEFDVKKLQTVVNPFDALFLAFLQYVSVQPVLMYNAFEPCRDERGHIPCAIAHFGFQNLVNIYEKRLCHVGWGNGFLSISWAKVVLFSENPPYTFPFFVFLLRVMPLIDVWP